MSGPQRLLVTGGLGFLGSHFVRHALATDPDVEVTNLDALTYAGNPANLADLEDDPRYRFVRGDVRDADLVNDLVSGHDAIAHFAAESHVDRSIDGPAPFLDTNVTGTGVLLEAARRHEVSRFLHVSTDEVYGPAVSGRFAEAAGLAPSSPYAASKAGAELLVRSYRVTYGYPALVTRSTNCFGPNHHPEKVVPLFILNALEGRALPVYGDGRHVRDWTFVADNAAAQWLVLTEGEPGSIYNVGAGNERTNLELARAVLAAAGADADLIQHVADRPGHDRRYAVDSTRVRALGWEPQARFEDALAATVDWYRDHPGWWEPLRQAGASRRRGVTGPTVEAGGP